MITAIISINNLDESNGSKNVVLSHDIRSFDSFEVIGTQSMKIPITTAAEVLLSGLVPDLESISSLTVVAKSQDDNIFPLFDVSMLDSNGDPLVTQRVSVYTLFGAQGLQNDIKIDNFEERGASPELQILITLR